MTAGAAAISQGGRPMKVILRQNVDSLGKAGDLVKV
ncbi:MAG: hypothetical protein KKC25_13395, partial [Proteobacteria bacterium]|nr:hypothetical protein [Pseudomonadota bacterium]